MHLQALKQRGKSQLPLGLPTKSGRPLGDVMWKTGHQFHQQVLTPQLLFSHITPEEQNTFPALPPTPIMAIFVSVALLAGAAALTDIWQRRKSYVSRKYEEHDCKGVVF